LSLINVLILLTKVNRAQQEKKWMVLSKKAELAGIQAQND
jgi:hypothetical protein